MIETILTVLCVTILGFGAVVAAVALGMGLAGALRLTPRGREQG